ncbi:hypothetical protein [Paracoccus tegillarcae]|uniref:Excinuclease ABC subunit A n=1 Tax=Paracoccus tegillarcae TaxID=1529068 RepID=A0A2K9F4B9_9RHOB|nr:hypothetical protein [Paracoccus tegillarcae]AUH33981.1 hypothetical protein CUV01_11775 [Paracoccus tegillarcae]
MIRLGATTAAVLAVTMAVAPGGSFAKEKQHNKSAGAEQSVLAANCPPGLAKKDPPCVPPGQAKAATKRALAVGDTLEFGAIHVISQPGLYGLGSPPPGNRYAIVNSRLVRIDARTGRLLSVIRMVNAVLD